MTASSNLPTNPKSAANWAHQTIQIFPPNKAMTPEFTAALVKLFSSYSEAVLAKALDPMKLISAHQYLPDLHTFKSILDEINIKSSEQTIHAKRLADQIKEREMYRPKKSKTYYEGPIEEVRAGDILSYARMEEYNKFIRSKNIAPRNFGFHEDWKDSGARPFAAILPKIDEKQPE